MIVKIFLALFSISATIAYSQEIPNGDFENWKSFSKSEMPNGWLSLDPYMNGSCVKSEDAFSGQYSIELKSFKLIEVLEGQNAKMCTGQVWLGELLNHSCCFQKAQNEVPDSIVGWYKLFNSEVETSDRDFWILKASVENDNQAIIAYCDYKEIKTTNKWSRFSIPLTKLKEDNTCDTLFLAIRCNSNSGTTVRLDNLKFIYNSSSTVSAVSSTFEVYPNIASNIISIKSKDDDLFKISTEIGQEILKVNVLSNEAMNVDIRLLPNGVYLITNSSNESLRFIINH